MRDPFGVTVAGGIESVRLLTRSIDVRSRYSLAHFLLSLGHGWMPPGVVQYGQIEHITIGGRCALNAGLALAFACSLTGQRYLR